MYKYTLHTMFHVKHDVPRETPHNCINIHSMYKYTEGWLPAGRC